MSAEGPTTSIETISGAADQQQQQVQLQIDDSDAPTHYSTTARVWGSAEEINLDFAGPIRSTNQPKVAKLKVEQRVILNPWAAKRLAIALNQAVARYEQAYGALELDERKRRSKGAGSAAPSQTPSKKLS